MEIIIGVLHKTMKYTVETIDKMRELVAKKFGLKAVVASNQAECMMLETLLQTYIMGSVTLAQLEQDDNERSSKTAAEREHLRHIELLNEQNQQPSKKKGFWG